MNGLSVDTKTITGSFDLKGYDNASANISSSSVDGTVFKKNQHPSNSKQYSQTSSSVDTCWISFDGSHDHTLSGDTETRPDNYTIKVWKRTA